MELLEDGDMDFIDDIKSILKTSSKVLSARLKFFRLAFGLNNPTLEDATQIKIITQEYLNTVGGKNPPQLEYEDSLILHHRAVMLAVMSMADLLIRGGNIKVSRQENKTLISIQGGAAVAAEKFEQAQKVLQNNAENISAQDAPLLSLLEFCCDNSVSVKYTTIPSFQIVLE